MSARVTHGAVTGEAETKAPVEARARRDAFEDGCDYAPMQARRRNIPKPTRAEDVPLWLADAYGIVWLDGALVPENGDAVQGWEAAGRYAPLRAGASHPRESRSRVLWQERAWELELEARSRRGAALDALLAQMHEALAKMYRGEPFPYVETTALVEFLYPHMLRDGGLPLEALLFVAWCRGLLTEAPTAGKVADVRRLLDRHWERPTLDRG
jgi:hypothetical protein